MSVVEILSCPGCHDAAAQSAARGGVVVCRYCGERWGEEPGDASCGGCEEARAYLERQSHSAPQKGPRVRGEGVLWPAGPSAAMGAVACADCGAVVTMTAAGAERHAERKRARAERAESVARRGRLLRDLDHLARWDGELSVRAQQIAALMDPDADGRPKGSRGEPTARPAKSAISSPTGCRGGGANLAVTDKSDRVLEDHEGLARAIGLRARLDAIGRDPAHAESYAVLTWLAFECPHHRRRHLAEAVGERFVKRPAEARRMAQLVEVERRKSIPPVKDHGAHRQAATDAYSAEVADARRERDAAFATMHNARTVSALASTRWAYEQACARLESVLASRGAAVARAEREVAQSVERYTPEQAVAATRRVEKVPSKDEVKRRGDALLERAEIAWAAGAK